MKDRKVSGTAAARRKNRRPSRRPGSQGGGGNSRNPRSGRNEQSTGEAQLSDDIAQEHEPQLNQLQDEPVRSSHYDERDRRTEQQDAGQE